MAAKLIDRSVFQSDMDYERAIELARSVKARHTSIAIEQEQFNKEKKELTDLSKGIFFDDLTERATPQLHGNHEYHTPEGILSVNFKVSGSPVEDAKIKRGATTEEVPAATYLRDKLGDEYYGKLFSEQPSYTVTASETVLCDHATKRPELFRVELKPDIPPEVLAKLITEFPDYVTVAVTDIDQYTKVFPDHVTKTVKVKVCPRFIEQCSKLPEEALKKARTLLKGLLTPRVSTAVNCGEAAKTK